MSDLKLGVVEQRFADIIWANEPITSGKLVEMCNKELGWKKSTTYTVLKKLCDKGIFSNNNGTVTSNYMKDDYNVMKCERIIKDEFGGSLPTFIAAFTRKNKLSKEEITKIEQLINSFKE
ncbi:MAG: BlaI/MecI/CopY family transcriptional regulator [Ruminococcaceae bacterium]|nr:BlaI/MecI/CopY family transcriptional regulator [Oscillospiraceae bacterium]